VTRFVATDQGVGRLNSDGSVDIFAPAAFGVDELLLDGANPEKLASSPTSSTIAAEDVRLRAPVHRPTKVWAVGYAYAEHSAEVGREQDADEDPIIFLKATTSITGPTDDIRLPALCPDKVDYEGEIAVVIGRRAYDIAPAAARDHILGVTAADDVSARDVQRGLYNGGNPDPGKGKSFDTFTPLGPCIVTLDEYDDPDDIGLATYVDGEQRQGARSSMLRNDISKLVAFASRFGTLEPGDVLLTGTPAGVGHPRNRFLAPGSVVRVEVEGVGALENTVVAPDAQASVRT
jgi:2-keto-4-pentenoate hydratase/2-oxohepta-3-ene-1,7-dioic acid hydratase in catechol pathway